MPAERIKERGPKRLAPWPRDAGPKTRSFSGHGPSPPTAENPVAGKKDCCGKNNYVERGAKRAVQPVSLKIVHWHSRHEHTCTRMAICGCQKAYRFKELQWVSAILHMPNFPLRDCHVPYRNFSEQSGIEGKPRCAKLNTIGGGRTSQDKQREGFDCLPPVTRRGAQS